MATVRGWEKFCHFHAYTCIITVMYDMLYHICLVGLIHTVIFHLFSPPITITNQPSPLESRWISLLLFLLLILCLNFTWSKNILDVCGKTISCAGGFFSELPYFSKDYDIGRDFNLFRLIESTLHSSSVSSKLSNSFNYKLPACELLSRKFFPIELQTVYI